MTRPHFSRGFTVWLPIKTYKSTCWNKQSRAINRASYAAYAEFIVFNREQQGLTIEYTYVYIYDICQAKILEKR